MEACPCPRPRPRQGRPTCACALAVLATLVVGSALCRPAAAAAAAPDAGTYFRLQQEPTSAAPAVSLRATDACMPHPLAVNTTERLRMLRERMEYYGIAAYIVTSSDEHQSEYVADHDRRRDYVSGFTGSAGDAVVTLDAAALWTDSRYYLQAEEQLDCNWQLMRTGDSQTPSIAEWLKASLNPGVNVSADPKLASYNEWSAWNSSLYEAGLDLVVITNNLVDEIWGSENGQPPYPSDKIFVLDQQFTGESWQDKIGRLRIWLQERSADALVLTALDEIAWNLNLRGGDVPYTPVFRSYLIITLEDATLYLPAGKSTAAVVAHLNSDSEVAEDSVRIKNYNEVWYDLAALGQKVTKVILPQQYSYAKGVSYLVYIQFPEHKIQREISPVLLMKTRKNSVEAMGMWNAHIRDGVALCQFLADLEHGVLNGEYWDELQAVEILEQYRLRQVYNNGSSFGTIAAFGLNSALPHYQSTNSTNLRIDTSGLFMLDSGGQYLDGTTDVTRTMHYGVPTEEQRTIYTKLLMGCINIATTIFPEGKTLSELEILIRAPLYSLGLNYGHGSTHGIGSFLAVHEAFNTTYHENFFGSQEPGYYRDNEFGMRLENIVTVVPANVSGESGETFLTFETVTLVPYEPKLINTQLMTADQVKWLNSYHDRVRKTVGAQLLYENDFDTYSWLVEKTLPLRNVWKY
ncbi:xaa-Pro aminopeptidase ApepP-like [Schistocerca nitens]|uniref:xaa-Pro aminopeptidase ApepP-like n=1 Tax=Schistocerca nitens TaxID=7011 RepID=UPI0021197B1B|nr:xaa-Pro aminopeptidase ApepP-like [Schistocerca nitens]